MGEISKEQILEQLEETLKHTKSPYLAEMLKKTIKWYKEQ